MNEDKKLNWALMASLKENFRQALRARMMAEAEEILARIAKEDPVSVETRACELELCLESGRMADANTLADQLCRAFPDSARVFFLAGKLAYRQKHYDTAEARFRECRRIYPSPQAEYWLGKTLTQTGGFAEAESLLLAIRDQNPSAWLELGWLHERREDFEAALRCYGEYLRLHPGHAYAMQQQVRIKAWMLDPEALIAEAETLVEFGECLPDALFPEFVQKLFETGQSPRARDEIRARIESLPARESVQLAWICYQRQAYDLACTLFLAHLRPNKFNFKYLAALEAAARKCNRLPEVLEAYLPLCPEARHLYGRRKLLAKRGK